MRQTHVVPDHEERRRMFEDRVREIDARLPGYAAKWRQLESIVLTGGGYAIVPRFDPDPLIDILIDRGETYSGETVMLKPGTERECHRNSADLWRSGEAVAIGTGYALSEDGLWREHTWAWNLGAHLVETTEPRAAYFGLRLEETNAKNFADWISE